MEIISIPRPLLTVLLKTTCVPCKRTIKIEAEKIKITDIKFTGVFFLSIASENAVTLKWQKKCKLKIIAILSYKQYCLKFLSAS